MSIVVHIIVICENKTIHYLWTKTVIRIEFLLNFFFSYDRSWHKKYAAIEPEKYIISLK